MAKENDVFERGTVLAAKVIDACQGETPSCAVLAVTTALVGLFRAAEAEEQAAHELLDALFHAIPAKAG